MILEKKKGVDVKKIEPLRHVVDARHIQNLGQNSVSDRHQAVLEIAKNSYDADAGNLRVTLVGRTTSAGSQYITIEKIRFFDNGNGMTYEDLRDRWMRIATDSKVRETESPVKHRRVSGEKGMGRFSMQKLGQKVTITTNPFMWKGLPGIPDRTTDYPGKKFKFTHDWQKYAADNTLLSDIETPVTAEDVGDSPHGTLIEITELNENWNVMQPGLKADKLRKGENDFEKLSRVLRSLVKPKEISDENDFKIEISAEGFQHEITEVATSLTDLAPYSITASLPAGPDPMAQCTFRRRKDIANKHAKIQRRAETEKFTAPTAGSTFGKAELVIYYFPGRSNDWSPSGSPTKAGDLTRMLADSCGIRIFNDSVRVMPYGEIGDDWLELGARYSTRRESATGAGHIRNASIIGFLKLTRKDNPKITETASRQKLVENDEFISLKEHFITKVLEQLETQVQKDKDEDDKYKKKEKALPKAISIEAELKRFLARTDLKDAARKDIEKLAGELKHQVTVADQATEEAEDLLREKTELYRTVATFGLTGLAYEHDINSSLGRIGDKLKILSRPKTKAKLGEDAVHLEDAVDLIKQALDWSQYSMTLASQSSVLKKSRRAELDVESELGKLKRQYRPLTEMHNVDFDPKVRGTLGIYMSKSNWLSIFNNMMTNSIKALAGVAREKKRVTVTVEKTSTSLIIEWDDNGSGIAEEDLPNIFELLWTNRSNKFNLSLGLGLNIVQEIMEDLKGTIKIKETVDDNKEPGRGRTTFMLEIPLTSLTKDGT